MMDLILGPGGIVILILTCIGGWITAAASWYKTRATTPAERDSLIVTGAGAAVLAMQNALKASDDRARDAEAEVVELRTEIQTLRSEVEELRRSLRDSLDALDQVSRRLAHFEVEPS
jgi:chromosome segregation ATPase